MKQSVLKICSWIVAMLATTAVNAYDFQVNGVYYNGNATAKTASVTKGDALYSGTVTIPATVTNGNVTYDVTSIEPNAFANCIHLTGVNIGSKVNTIGSRAFLGCEELVEIVIPDGVSTFGVASTKTFESDYNKSETFVGCIALETVTLGSKVASMGIGLFGDCTALKNVTIKEGCAIIGESCFKGCTKIAGLTIPNTVQTICDEAFNGCTALKSISIPNSVTSIGNRAFLGCTSMTQVTMGSGVRTLGSNAFQGCTHLQSAILGSNLRTINSRAFYNCEELESIVIPDEVETFGVASTKTFESDYNKSEVFVGCVALASATLGSKVANMGSGLFMNCTALKNVTIKEGCSYIGPTCFMGCTKMANITIPNSVVNIDEQAFYGCTALKSIDIPESVLSIGNNAFRNCTAMTQAIVGDGVTTLGSNAFDGCTHLRTAILGSSLRTINSRAFYNCEELESIVIPDEVETFGVASTKTFESDYNKSEVFVGCIALESATLGKKVANMGSGLFLNCTALKNITIKEGCSYIGPTCFKGCTKIANVIIPNTVENIDEQAFSGCTALKSIVIPESVLTVGNSAFQDCTAMTKAVVGDGVITLGSNAFYGCTHLRTATLGNNLRTINSRAFYNCEELEAIVIPDGVVTFGVASTKTFESDYNKSEVFVGCIALESATLGKKVAEMGSGLFMNCTSLKNVTIKEGCSYIGISCFKGCSKIANVTIPNSMENIDEQAFSGCTALKSIGIPENVLTIGDNAFYGCTSMTQAIMGDGLTTLGNNAFYNCSALSTLVLGSELRTINSRAFYGCKALTEVVVPDNVKTLGVASTKSFEGDYNKSETFANCTSLKSVTLGKKLSSVGLLVFNGCTALETVTARMAEPITVNANVFPYRASETLYVYADSKNLYAAADVWKEFGTIAEIGPEKTPQTLSLTSLPTMNVGERYTLPSATVQGLTLTWTSSNSQVATVSGNVLTAKAAGTATITATQAGNSTYQSFRRDFTLTVEEQEVSEASMQIANISARGGQQVELPIMLTSGSYEGSIAGVSFTLELPEGVTVATDEYDEAICSFVSDRVNQRQFSVTAAQDVDGSWGFRVYTTAATGTIKGAQGVFMTVTLSVAEGMADGDYTINMTENKLSVREEDNNVKSVVVNDASAMLTIENYILGDVNGDGEVDLSDAIMVTYYSLHVEPAGFIRAAADVNGDGDIDLSDAIIIIYKSLGVVASRSIQPTAGVSSTNDYMQMAVANGNCSLSLTNEGEYLGLQCDVILPQGTTLDDVSLNESRAEDHTVLWNKLEEGRYRIAIFSTSGTPFFGNMGELLSLALSTEVVGEVKVENLFLVGTDLLKHSLSEITLQTTGVKGIEAEKSELQAYDLQGRMVKAPVKGIILRGNKKQYYQN